MPCCVFCGRCDFHITRASSYFIGQAADPDNIKKIYLPMSDAGDSKKIQVVACATPSTAVDYIRKFIEDHKGEIDKRKADLAAGKAKDACLLILSPSKAVDFYKLNGARDELFKLVASHRAESRKFSEEFAAIDDKHVQDAISKANSVRDIVDSQKAIFEKVRALAERIQISDIDLLRRDLERDAIDKQRVEAIEHQDEEEAELEEIQVKQMSAVELMTIVGSKGLSADHVIIIGFDNVNMNWVTRNAFFVAKTRARRSLHIITALKAGGAAGPHAFLNHLPDEHLEFLRYKKSDRTQVTFSGRNAFLRYLTSLNAQGRRR
jgi:superfamily I DNA/RNA helicase